MNWPRVLVAVLPLLLGSCLTSALNRSERLNPSGLFEVDSDIARTFDGATIVLPRPGDEPLVAGLDEPELWRDAAAALPGPLPTVMYLHGCTGLRNLEPLKAMARAGYAVIAPDSFARRFRPLQCRPSERTGGDNVYVYDFRLAEVSYGLYRLAELSWVDRRRLVLMGVSEGGVAAALYRGDEFRGRIIAQWTCHGRPFVRGLAAGPDEAILAIVRTDDPWYDSARTKDQAGDCGSFFGSRANSESLTLKGEDRHDVFDEPSVVHKLTAFLLRLAQ